MTHRLGIVALLAVAMAVFYPAFSAEFVDYDDPAFVTQNPYVLGGVSLTGVRWAFTQEDLGESIPHAGVRNVWHPLTWLSHMLDAQFWGPDHAAGHHATSIAIHFLTTIFAYLCFLEILKASKKSLPPTANPALIAWFTAAFFCAHPLHVESVAWISERKDVLSGFFFFSSLFAHLRKRRAVSVALFCLGLLAKPSIVVLPAVLMLLDWRRTGFRMAPREAWFSIAGAQVRDKLPWLIPAALAATVAVLMQRGGTHGEFMQSLPMTFRLLTLGTSILFYLWRTLWPADLSFHYPYPAWPLWAHVATTAVAGLLGIAAWRMRRRFPAILFGALWFAVLLLPMSGILYVGTSFTADRYTYLAMTGIFFAVATLLSGASSAKMARAGFVLIAVMLLASAALAHRQVSHWRNSESLFTHAAESRPRDPVGIQNLGGLYQRERKFTEAAALYERALALNPRNYNAHYNLGNCLRESGDLAGARAAFESSLLHYPGFAPAKLNLGLVLADPRYGESDGRRAAKLVREACEETDYRIPNYVAALITLELAQGKVEEARATLERAPDPVRAHATLIELSRRLQRDERAAP